MTMNLLKKDGEISYLLENFYEYPKAIYWVTDRLFVRQRLDWSIDS